MILCNSSTFIRTNPEFLEAGTDRLLNWGVQCLRCVTAEQYEAIHVVQSLVYMNVSNPHI